MAAETAEKRVKRIEREQRQQGQGACVAPGTDVFRPTARAVSPVRAGHLIPPNLTNIKIINREDYYSAKGAKQINKKTEVGLK